VLGYTGPRAGLAYRGLGEISIALTFGAFSVYGSAFVQAGKQVPEAVLPGVILSALIFAVILVNEFTDAETDECAGKRTLVVRMGRREAVRLLRAAFTMVFAITIAGILWGGAPWGCVALFLFLPACEKICRLLKAASRRESFEAASGRAVFIHALGGLILCLAYAAPQIVKGLP